jgi:hypothetical protein
MDAERVAICGKCDSVSRSGGSATVFRFEGQGKWIVPFGLTVALKRFTRPVTVAALA